MQSVVLHITGDIRGTVQLLINCFSYVEFLIVRFVHCPFMTYFPVVEYLIKTDNQAGIKIEYVIQANITAI